MIGGRGLSALIAQESWNLGRCPRLVWGGPLALGFMRRKELGEFVICDRRFIIGERDWPRKGTKAQKMRRGDLTAKNAERDLPFTIYDLRGFGIWVEGSCRWLEPVRKFVFGSQPQLGDNRIWPKQNLVLGVKRRWT